MNEKVNDLQYPPYKFLKIHKSYDDLKIHNLSPSLYSFDDTGCVLISRTGFLFSNPDY